MKDYIEDFSNWWVICEEFHERYLPELKIKPVKELIGTYGSRLYVAHNSTGVMMYVKSIDGGMDIKFPLFYHKKEAVEAAKKMIGNIKKSVEFEEKRLEDARKHLKEQLEKLDHEDNTDSDHN